MRLLFGTHAISFTPAGTVDNPDAVRSVMPTRSTRTVEPGRCSGVADLPLLLAHDKHKAGRREARQQAKSERTTKLYRSVE